jgi:MFS family permease
VVALPGLVAVGIGAGAFLAVDWALMTDIIPRESAGRYMGISNVGTALAGPIPAIAGGLLLDAVFRLDPAASPRVAYAVGIVLFVLAAVLLRPVDPASRRT